MVWARLDDQFHDHPKLAEFDPDLMLPAVGLHMLAISWCADRLTDGVIPAMQPRRLAGGVVDNLTAELVRVGLWDKHPKGFKVHDYLDYNPSRAQVKATQEAQKTGGRLGAKRRWGSKSDNSSHGSTYGDTHGSTYKDTDGGTDGVAIGQACPEPEPEPEPVPDTRIPYQKIEDTSDDVSLLRDTADDDGIEWEEPTQPPKRRSPTPYQKIVDLFNECCPSLPSVQSIANDSRRKRLKAAHDALGMDGLETFFRRVEASDFLAGRTKEQARFGIDWITKPGNFVKILEGNYDNRGTSVPAMNTNTQRALEIFRELKEGEDAGK